MPPERSVIAIDQGTTGTKAHRLHGDGRFETIAGFEHRQIYPQQGWVEHDPEELARHVEAALERAGDASAIGIANQGETVIAWDGDTKRPIHNAIVWQDARTSGVTERMKADGAEELTLKLAGLPLDPYFSAAKLRWLLDNVPEAKSLRSAGRLRLGTSDAFFLDRLTGRFATDVTTASRTSLMNLETLQWDARLAELFGVPIECLPEIRPTAGPFAEARGIPVTASLVDQQAALFGHGCRRKGDAKITFGTGAFALAVAGATVPRDSESGLEATIAWKLGDAPCAYALQGGIYNAASAVNWARSLGLFADYKEIDEFAAEPAIARGLVFVPALSGLSCPYWDRRAAGLWLGMGLETTRSDMMQALLEGVALLARQGDGGDRQAVAARARALGRWRPDPQPLFHALPGRRDEQARARALQRRADRPRRRAAGDDRRGPCRHRHLAATATRASGDRARGAASRCPACALRRRCGTQRQLAIAGPKRAVFPPQFRHRRHGMLSREGGTCARSSHLSVFALLPASACAEPAQAARDLVTAARAQVGVTLIYDPSYQRIAYPMGDVRRSAACAATS